jgi:UDP:flavonoid glycosyltransferase YjiC (YdhE family)
MTFGQLDTAFRLKSLGVAEIVKPRAMSPQLLTKRLRTLLASESVSARCEELASRFAGSDPLEQTCDLLEELVGTDAR